MKLLRPLIIALLISIAPSSEAQKLPDEYLPIDTDGDAEIEVNEVQKVIDSFFLNDSAYSVEFIHGLIDYFFEQA